MTGAGMSTRTTTASSPEPNCGDAFRGMAALPWRSGARTARAYGRSSDHWRLVAHVGRAVRVERGLCAQQGVVILPHLIGPKEVPMQCESLLGVGPCHAPLLDGALASVDRGDHQLSL